MVDGNDPVTQSGMAACPQAAIARWGQRALPDIFYRISLPHPCLWVQST